MKTPKLKINKLENSDVISTSTLDLSMYCGHFAANRTDVDNADHIYVTAKDGWDFGYNYYQYSQGSLSYIGSANGYKGGHPEYDNIVNKNRWYYWDTATGKYVECESQYQTNEMHGVKN